MQTPLYGMRRIIAHTPCCQIAQGLVPMINLAFNATCSWCCLCRNSYLTFVCFPIIRQYRTHTHTCSMKASNQASRGLIEHARLDVEAGFEINRMTLMVVASERDKTMEWKVEKAKTTKINWANFKFFFTRWGLTCDANVEAAPSNLRVYSSHILNINFTVSNSRRNLALRAFCSLSNFLMFFHQISFVLSFCFQFGAGSRSRVEFIRS